LLGGIVKRLGLGLVSYYLQKLLGWWHKQKAKPATQAIAGEASETRRNFL
jgi:hypothetical protein